MGMSAATTAAEGIKFCIFDLRRGQQEGQELDKILFFFPADLPFSAQLSVIGLSEGLITFTRLVLPLVYKAKLVLFCFVSVIMMIKQGGSKQRNENSINMEIKKINGETGRILCVRTSFFFFPFVFLLMREACFRDFFFFYFHFHNTLAVYCTYLSLSKRGNYNFMIQLSSNHYNCKRLVSVKGMILLEYICLQILLQAKVN